jgi:PTS system nitrogen regulatory IIA component
MPHEKMDERQVAAYLGMELKEVTRLASRGAVPCRKTDFGKFVFRKSDVDHWVWERMHSFDRGTIEGIEKGVIAHHGLEATDPIVCPMIDEKCVAVPFDARTGPAVLRGMVEIADENDLVYDKVALYRELRGRERLCSTALLPGVAFPHPRHPLPKSIVSSFIIVALTSSGVPFGAEDGSLTRLFFLICCKDDRTHLHVLARLVRMLDVPGQVERMQSCEDAVELEELLAHREMEVINS